MGLKLFSKTLVFLSFQMFQVTSIKNELKRRSSAPWMETLHCLHQLRGTRMKCLDFSTSWFQHSLTSRYQRYAYSCLDFNSFSIRASAISLIFYIKYACIALKTFHIFYKALVCLWHTLGKKKSFVAHLEHPNESPTLIDRIALS
jgi:hypothetical protein